MPYDLKVCLIKDVKTVYYIKLKRVLYEDNSDWAISYIIKKYINVIMLLKSGLNSNPDQKE